MGVCGGAYPILGTFSQSGAHFEGFVYSAGPVSCRFFHGEIREPLRADAVRDIIRRRAQLTDQPLGRLSAHSLRSGFVTEAASQNISLGETMSLTGHRSVQTVMAYYRAGEVGRSKASRLLDVTPTED